MFPMARPTDGTLERVGTALIVAAALFVAVLPLAF